MSGTRTLLERSPIVSEDSLGRGHPLRWRARDHDIVLTHPIILGVVNATPDSFSDGGRYLDADRAVAHAERLIAEGADIIDIGGESTRPQGAMPVSDEEELQRVLPVVERVAKEFPTAPISVDTTKSRVARAALEAGASIVNDVSGFRLDPQMGEITAAAMAGVILMHSRGVVSDMATFTHAEYGDDVVADVIGELRGAVARAESAGVRDESIVLDPGIGFAKRGEHSLATLAGLERLVALGFPVLVGVSRKRFIGEISGVTDPAERVNGTVGANIAALMLGARLFRVHDVRPNREALDVAWKILAARGIESVRPPSDSRS